MKILLHLQQGKSSKNSSLDSPQKVIDLWKEHRKNIKSVKSRNVFEKIAGGLPLEMKDKKILIVDFDANSLDTLSEFLEDEGFQIVKAKDGQSGLEKFESERPDLLILEPMIPKLHGFDLCKNIANDSGKRTPVIFTTEFYGEEQCKREASRASNLTAFFRKPYRKEDVLSSALNLLKEGEKKRVFSDQTQKDLAEREVTPKKEPLEQKKASELPDDIDKMLQNTISEFGLDIGTEKETVPDKQDREKIEKEKKAEQEQIDSESKEFEKKEDEEEKGKEEKEKTETAAAEEVKGAALDDEELFRRSKSVLFTEFSEEPKGFSLKPYLENLLSKLKSLRKIQIRIPALRIILPLGFAALIAGGATIYFLRPKHVDSSPKVRSVLSHQQDSNRLPLVELPSSILAKEEKTQENTVSDSTEINTTDASIPKETNKDETATEPTIQTETKPLKAPETKPAPKKAPLPPPAESEPMLSESSDFLKIQENPQEEPKTEEVRSEKMSLPVAFDNKPEEKKQDQSLNTPEEKKFNRGDLVALSMVNTPPILIRRVQPKYPPLALSQGFEDQVLINALISETGEVTKTMIIRGERESYGFNQAAEEAVRQWRFRPAVKNSAKVKVWKPILIKFKKK
jgi:TonB family protein